MAGWIVLCLLAGPLAAAAEARDDDRAFAGIQVKLDPDGKGIVITGFFGDESPAQKAGLKEDDLVTHLDGVPYTELQPFVQAVGAHKPGDEVVFKVLRKGEEKQIKVKLGKRPPDPA
jgi:S1-C subfamily serine protease